MQSVGALTSRAVTAVLFMVPLIVVEALLGVIRSSGNPQFPTFGVGTRRTAVTYLDTADADQLPARSERWLAPLTATPPRVYTLSGRITDAAARLVTVLPLLVGLPIAGGVAFLVAVSSLPD